MKRPFGFSFFRRPAAPRESAPDDQDRFEAQALCLAPGTTLPADGHPFWAALDALAEAIAANFAQHGFLEADRRGRTEDMMAKGHGTGLIVSSDAPDWALLAWIYLPKDPLRRQEIARLFVTHLTAARHALPEASWKVTLGGRDIAWDPEEGFSVAA